MTDGAFKAFLRGDMPNYFEFFRRAWWNKHLFPNLRHRFWDEVGEIRGD